MSTASEILRYTLTYPASDSERVALLTLADNTANYKSGVTDDMANIDPQLAIRRLRAELAEISMCAQMVLDNIAPPDESD